MSTAVIATRVLLSAIGASPAVAAKKVRKGPAGTAFYSPPSKLPGSKHGDAIWARKLAARRR